MGVKLGLSQSGTNRLRVFETSMLGKTFELTREQVKGDWKKLHNDMPHDLCSSQNINQMMK
jgi:hypothetical protein